MTRGVEKRKEAMEIGSRKPAKKNPGSRKKRKENEIRRGEERSHRNPWIQEGHVFQVASN